MDISINIKEITFINSGASIKSSLSINKLSDNSYAASSVRSSDDAVSTVLFDNFTDKNILSEDITALSVTPYSDGRNNNMYTQSDSLNILTTRGSSGLGVIDLDSMNSFSIAITNYTYRS